jgi:hypothetical protein
VKRWNKKPREQSRKNKTEVQTPLSDVNSTKSAPSQIKTVQRQDLMRKKKATLIKGGFLH